MSIAWKCTDTLGNDSTVWEKHLQSAPWTTRLGVRKNYVGAEAADNKRKTRSWLGPNIQRNRLTFRLPFVLCKTSKSNNTHMKNISFNGGEREFRAYPSKKFLFLHKGWRMLAFCFTHHPLESRSWVVFMGFFLPFLCSHLLRWPCKAQELHTGLRSNQKEAQWRQMNSEVCCKTSGAKKGSGNANDYH